MKIKICKNKENEAKFKNEIEFLESIGNDIAFFEHATDSNKKVWMYVTK